MVTITCYGGAGQIGGNKILLADRDTKIWLDFGEPFNMQEKFFIDWLKPRDRLGLRDYFHFDYVPRIEGLYDEDWLEHTDLRPAAPEFDAILVSHMHFDHTWHLKFAHRDIPVYLGMATDAIRRAWEDTGSHAVDFGEHEFRTFRTGGKFKIGSLEVEPIHVDHSVPGAYGYLVHTSEGCVAYTGDLRMHGPKASMTRDFISRATEEHPIAMICEGTRVSDEDPREDLSEADVRTRVQSLVSGTRKLAVVAFYPKDVDRVRTYRDVAKATGRKFVVSAKVAHMLESLSDAKLMDAPNPMTDENMLVYVRTGMAGKNAYERRYLDLVRGSGRGGHVVESEFVKKNQRDLIFHTDFSQLPELIDVAPEEHSLFIRSQSEPFEEDDIREDILQNWLGHLGLLYHHAHASGHASMDEVFGMLKGISPGMVIPVHTEHPELFQRTGLRVVQPVPRQPLSVSS